MDMNDGLFKKVDRGTVILKYPVDGSKYELELVYDGYDYMFDCPRVNAYMNGMVLWSVSTRESMDYYDFIPKDGSTTVTNEELLALLRAWNFKHNLTEECAKY